jgi:hypothetical protein
MRQIVVTSTTTGASNAIPLDTYIAPCQVSVGIAMDAGSEVAVQHTFSNVLDASITPVWYPTFSSVADEGYLLQENGDAILQEDGSFLLTGNVNTSHFIDFPVSAIRLNVLANAGTVTMTVLQAGMSGR